MTEFFQDPPRLTNTYKSHRWLRSYLRCKLPQDIREAIEVDLQEFGANCASTYMELARRAEREKPELVQYDAWGRRRDEIRVSTAWEELQNISAREGLISIGYTREFKEFSRLYQFTKLYLFHPSSAFFTCPLAMADGAAKVLEQYGSEDIHKEAFQHLTANEPSRFWTSGQWMTERTGGSDVGETSTHVRYDAGQARLYGTKWFSSATTSQMALALARCPDSPAGSRGLTLFFVPMHLQPGQLNHIRVLRLKDKLGTWALPTAELQLEGAFAYQVGAKDQGVKTVATMLNITRLYNSVCSIGQATRALEQLKDYSGKRVVFGAPLDKHVLHSGTFAGEEVKLMAGFLLTMELVHLLGKEECGSAGAHDSDILRLMTPVCKLFTARSAIQTASEVVEGFGGAGYIEDTGIPVHLRDSQVFPIWEGATNVLSLDMLRVLQKTAALQSLKEDVNHRLKGIRGPELASYRDQIATKLQGLELRLGSWAKGAPEDQVASARDLSFHLGWLYACVLALVWIDQETPENKRMLTPWLIQMLRQAGDWKPKDSEEIQRGKEIWQTTLKI
ncbi:MAG: acyl-CoA dehydrogenase family protein [Bdellovibrionales bacterium]|nr:acyl-CoA dehydrogenase family protein [Bdellovibrionales bacterium]